MTNIGSLSIEARVGQVFENIANEAGKDLESAVGRIETNISKKKELRALQQTFQSFKTAVEQGKQGDANKLMERMKKQADTAGFPEDSELFDKFNEIPEYEMEKERKVPRYRWGNVTWGTKTEKYQKKYNGTFPDSPPKEDAKAALDGYLKGIETYIDSQAQNVSDVSQVLQIKLNQANGTYTRAFKSISDINSRFTRNRDQIANNYKG